MCTDVACQCGNKKSKTIFNIFKKLLPKRRKKQNSYLPLTQLDIDDEVEIKSHNYCQENWDALSTDTSPTYPFGGRSSPDTSEEEQELLGGRRIRGGECKHLINCKFIGRECRDKKVRSSEALGLRRLNKFSTHSLPPKYQQKNKKDSFFQYFANAEELLSGIASEDSMKRTETSRGKKSSINTNNKKLENTDLLPSQASSPPSADSVLSENTCSAIFGTLPEGLTLKSEEPSSSQQNLLFGSAKLEKATGNEASLKSASIESRISKISNQSIKDSIADTSASKESPKIKFLEQAPDSTLKRASISDQQPNSLKENQTGIIQPAAAKQHSTQLNQLLYKDDRTEISLVQKLGSKKESTSSRTSFNEQLPTTSWSHTPIKLKISLHNTLIPDEEEIESLAMASPKSQDKIVETKDSFPLHQDWPGSSKTGKVILSSDKTQQTSDNNFYRTPGEKTQYSSSTPSRRNISDYSRVSSDPKYDLPEKDVICKRNNCSCAICKTKQLPQASHCSCCRCANAIDSHRTQEPIYHEQMMVYPEPNYHVTAYPPSSTNTDIPDYLPPLPPAPQRHPRRPTSPAQYRNRCHEKCTCGLKPPQLFICHPAGFNQPSGSLRCQPESDRYNMEYANRDEYEYSDRLRDLPYQNNEEYLQLVEELQDTLHSRNRNRVKRAMQEFEARSKQNKPLEKPIINYDETSDSEEPIIRKIDQLRVGKIICCAGDKCTCGKMKLTTPKPRRHQRRREKLDVDERPSHWTMDPGSGEWQKANRSRMTKDEEFKHHCTCNCINCEQRY
ncbi:unnamed protein product [Ceutorhynchus assimilis]|uniref:Uncharacterized protein n=1 Tax=Ceutorhynchus assimilis TaxID=467358 RepID=A0A9N9MHM4_9CUCU|nr:unnamed protein product [Ceutorhynchus assimilis]